MTYESNHVFGRIGRIGRMALLFAGVLFPLALFGLLAEDVAERESFWFDRPILLFVHTMSSSFLDTAMYWITQAGSAVVLVPFNAVVLAWLLKRRQRNTAAFWAISVVGAAVINFAAKNMFTRVRPSMWLSRIAETTYSFPSGHAMGTMAAVTALCMLLWPTRWRRLVLGVGGLYVALVGTSRVYFGVHYPSDILAGWAASLAWVVGVKLLLDHRLRRAGGKGATSAKTA
jgi:membrane-associated phospholipid phosphatase